MVNCVDCAAVGFIFERPPHLDQLSASQIPDAERHVVARRIDPAIAVDDRKDILLVPFEDASHGPGLQIPNENPPVT